MLLLKISWRNVKRHKSRSIVIGIIIFIGALIMTLGNATITGMNRGIRRGIVENFTGDIVIISSKEKDHAVIFREMGKSVEVLKGYREISTILKDDPRVRDFVAAGRGTVLILNPYGDPGYTIVLGVDYPRYRRVFHNVKIVEGREIEEGEQGILINEKGRKMLLDMNGFWIVPEGVKLSREKLPENFDPRSTPIMRSLVLMGFTSDGANNDVRVHVRGIFKFKFLDIIWSKINLLDIKSFRECFNYSGYIPENEISGEDKALLDVGEDNLLEMLQQQGDDREDDTAAEEKLTTPARSTEDFYNMVFVKLKKGSSREDTIKDLNRRFREKKLEAIAIPWEEAVGQISDMTTIIRGALYGLSFFIFVVAIIIIINTLTMAVIERTTEIATMRSIGAGRNFIAGMFFTETSILAFISGAAGILTGFVITLILRKIGIPAGDNPFLQLIFGGSTYQPYLGVGDIIGTIIELTIVTILSVIYPIYLAIKVKPIEAIARE